MTPDENPTAEAILIELMLDSTSQTGRVAYCGVVSEELTNVASWLGIDSWLGGGDAADTAVSGQTAPARRAGFNAISLVVQFTSELTAGAISEIEAERAYSASALIRQLLECEYLLEVFRLNFDEGAAWYEATDEDLRKNYKVFQVRNVGGFSADEYRTHCERGGHPHPRGAYLLRLQNQIGQLRLPDDDRPVVDRTVDLWLDFAHHLHRIWTLAVDLLSTEHARFSEVRSTSLDRVEAAENAWRQADELADPTLRQRLINIVRADPARAAEGST